MDNSLKKELDKFKMGLFSLNTRRFGTVAEYMIQLLYNFDESKSLAFDKKDNKGNRIEVKFSRVLKENENSIKKENIIFEAKAANVSLRMIKSNEESAFDCNIQQVKTKEFDILYYGLFFDDIIYIYKIKSSMVKNIPGYSDKQHRGNVGEGQFHINNKNILEHEKYLDKKVSYEELYELFS